MVSNSMRRKGRHKWRYFVGISVLGFLIIASAAQAAPSQAGSREALPPSSAGWNLSATPFMQ
jgi:hypothetical protein